MRCCCPALKKRSPRNPCPVLAALCCPARNGTSSTPPSRRQLLTPWSRRSRPRAWPTRSGQGPVHGVRATDAAFAKIPKADLDALLADKAKLSAVLLAHVVPASVMSKDVKAGKVKTAGGYELVVTTSGGVTVEGPR